MEQMLSATKALVVRAITRVKESQVVVQVKVPRVAKVVTVVTTDMLKNAMEIIVMKKKSAMNAHRHAKWSSTSLSVKPAI
jgi:hypothetical protein